MRSKHQPLRSKHQPMRSPIRTALACGALVATVGATLVASSPHSSLALAATTANCTLYAAPNGSASNSGTSPGAPLTLSAAAGRTQPGSVVCLEAGTYAIAAPFEISRSGSASAGITYTSYDPANTALLSYASGSNSLIIVDPNVKYITLSDIRLNGMNTATNGVLCKGCRFLRVQGSSIYNMHSGGVVTYQDSASGNLADYITVDHNWFYHIGNFSSDGTPGASSAVSLNRDGWYDRAAGFHSYITNNIIAGTVDGSSYHSDGNGIILDYGGNSDATPPVLIANNLVYMNGGRCIHAHSAGDAWIVNNTCYKNGLDTRVASGYNGNNGEYSFWGSSDIHLVNNIAYAWNQGRPFSDETGGQPGAANAQYARNMWYSSGSGPLVVPSSVSADPNQLKNADARFVSPLYVNATASGQYANALAPWLIATQFHLLAGGPAIRAGVDPTTLTSNASIKAGLQQVVYTDLAGRGRPVGGPFDLGAYQYP